MPTNTLGRVQHYDPRNEGFRIHHMMSVRSLLPEIKYHYDTNRWLDQGTLPACTAFAACHYRDAGPVRPVRTTPMPDARTMYADIQRQDRAEGRHYPEGATSLAMAKVMRAYGWLGEFRWGYTLDELVRAALTDCVLVGTNWYAGMSQPVQDNDGDAFLTISGRLEGGHEYLVTGVNVQREFFRIKNSWGRTWGDHGRAFISFDAMRRLIEQEAGDVCLARELR